MNAEQLEDIALFRYELIQPLIAESFPDHTKQEYMKRIAATEMVLPNGKRGTVGVGTLKEWAANYRKFGLKGLKPKRRNDAGNNRRLNDEQKAEIIRLKTQSPNRPATVIRKRMIMTRKSGQDTS